MDTFTENVHPEEFIIEETDDGMLVNMYGRIYWIENNIENHSADDSE